jgi:hypothetical protein
VERRHHRLVDPVEERQEVPSEVSAEDAEFVLHADHVDVHGVDELAAARLSLT